MSKVLLIAAVAAVLTGCAKPAPPEDTCMAPDFTPKEQAGTYAGQREAVMICVRRAAFNLAKAGGPIAHAGEQALAQCSTEEAGVGTGKDKLYDWQRKQLHETLTHTGQIAATQARSIGCGLPPGAPRDTL